VVLEKMEVTGTKAGGIVAVLPVPTGLVPVGKGWRRIALQASPQFNPNRNVAGLCMEVLVFGDVRGTTWYMYVFLQAMHLGSCETRSMYGV
jgi:hypothetical protein